MLSNFLGNENNFVEFFFNLLRNDFCLKITLISLLILL